jgi:hypothetical protein
MLLSYFLLMALLKRIKCSFKFENRWIREEDFQSYAKSAWQKTYNKPFFYKN